MGIERILVVDDELLMRDFLTETLRRKDFDVDCAENGLQALQMVKKNAYDLVISDMKMPKMTGIELLAAIKEHSPETLVIIVTAFGSIENAVEAMHLGAFNYLIKPFSPDTVEAILQKANEHIKLVEENSFLRQQVSSLPQRGASSFKIIAQSKAMKQVLSTVERVAKSNASIFINGESGTGKEVISHAIHHFSPRAKNPYIRVNCAAIPDTLIESEFFGHEKGAFTGALTKRIGRFELAHQGTLLLDEVTEIPMLLQPKLLRVIQEREFERVGGSRSIQVDVRLVSTSNRKMEEAIEEQVFRKDLYYRLNVIPIHLPPLRERAEDILPLCEHFLDTICIENHKKRKKLTVEAKKRLQEYHWPGNIRELMNVIERCVVMDIAEDISPEHLFLESFHEEQTVKEHHEAPANQFVGLSLQELEKRMIIETLNQNQQNRTRTAEVLGISIRTLRNKLKEYHQGEGP